MLREDGVRVFCVSPGRLATGLGIGEEANRRAGAGAGAGDPRLGAEFVRGVVEGERDEEGEGIIGGEGGIGREGVQAW